MDYGTKKILLIGFFVFIWLFIAVYIYEKTSYGKEDVVFDDKQNEEIVKENHLNNKQEEFLELSVDDFLPENFSENKKTEQKNINEKSLLLHGDYEKEKTTKNTSTYKVNIESNKDESHQEELKNKGNIIFEQETQKEKKMCGEFPCFSGDEFVDIYNTFEQETKLPFLTKYIYKHKIADDYIRSIAERRGYQRRVFADESKLVSFETRHIQKQLRDNYISMRNMMKEENISLHFVSGYRNSTHQRRIFKNKLGNIDVAKIVSGIYDKKIDTVLRVSSIPAYSKHHSGYAVDFGCGNDYLVYTFDETKCYKWLSENNFENAKRYGFIPSYPEGVKSQGPNPEPWEFVWVGSDFIKNYE